MKIPIVKFAVYGALAQGDPKLSRTANVQMALQVAIAGNNGVVKINNQTLGCDPAVGTEKQFGAVVALDTVDHYFACKEGQTIDFFSPAPAH